MSDTLDSSSSSPSFPSLEADTRPSFLITIDTEGDNLWSKPPHAATKNASYIPRFQALCERYTFKPTYLVDYDMLRDPLFVELAADLLRRDAAEIGAHPHAWNTPPLVSLTDADHIHQPFLIEYPLDLMCAKAQTLTTLLEDTFGRKMVSHRAGRWSFNSAYAHILADAGYLIDCSVTPAVSWSTTSGAPHSNGGTDYSRFPENPYFLDLDDISRAGRSSLLEVPVSTMLLAPAPLAQLAHALNRNALAQRAVNRLVRVAWLRPRGGNLAQMVAIVLRAVREGRDHVEFMLHSSELMPGGSPTFQTTESIEALYRDLEQLFALASRRTIGMTLHEFYRHFNRPKID